ncbi:DNA polymerase alpha catalytic subunit [Tieghemostelium lacteum]|uniref:DNA polymerase n=1 Tax=Tieghemostelium lacteum TaxID=361077 RepID=A0A152A6I2_TIELA|nr:DNA polymerase alpha catalytic subunit [Tieghemostelium lacteum]|eukprot:KYR01843.1 DNA polymerase alpha catalytic subunit [Tieghemostelium lacteum]
MSSRKKDSKLKSLEAIKRAKEGQVQSQLDDLDFDNKDSDDEKDDNENIDEKDRIQNELKNKRKRRDFIVNDNGFGYQERSDDEDDDDDYDDDDEDDDDREYSSGEEAMEVGRKKKIAKKDGSKTFSKSTKRKTKDGSSTNASASKKKPVELAPEKNRISTFLDKGNLTSNPGNNTNYFSEKFKKSNNNATQKSKTIVDFDSMLDDLTNEPNNELDQEHLEEYKKQQSKIQTQQSQQSQSQAPSQITLNLDGTVDMDDNFEFSIQDDVNSQQPKVSKVLLRQQSSQKPVVSPKTVDNWWEQNNNADSVVSILKYDQMTPKNDQLLEKSGNGINLFLLSIEEDKQGRIMMFGKVKQLADKETQQPEKYVSCCVVVDHVPRNVYFLPRDYKMTDDLQDGTTIQVSDQMVEDEIKQVMSQHRISNYTCKPVQRGACFDYSVAHKNIPLQKSVRLWKVSYSANQPTVPNDIQGKTFQCVYGATSSATELFILKTKIMGPSWLALTEFQARFDGNRRSWCRYEGSVKSFKNIKPLPVGKLASPPVVVMSVAVKAVQNESNSEIVMISSVIHEHVEVDGATKNTKELKYSTVVRALKGQVLPPDFKADSKPNLTVCQSESALLKYFLETVLNVDPDIYTGHNIANYDLEILFDRFEKLKIMDWSYFGRLRRSQIDPNQSIGGRLICDLSVISKEFLTKEKNYSLVDLCKSQLKMEKQEINTLYIEPYFGSSKKLDMLVELNENDCYVVFLLLFHLQILPLTKQLTNLAGNQWDRSLKGLRAERIEYLLLHTFHQKKYLLPDKIKSKFEQKGVDVPNKAQYSGGLVLDPKIDFYDRYVVLLDFNSLYPSIIQEFNVCFTTIQRAKKDDGKWEECQPPNSALEKGILPGVLRDLVQKRREVKKKLEIEKDKESLKSQQLNIQQLAIKLVANSMYGCLGFSFSRFYALPLAELVTRKGRENLQQAQTVTTRMNYEVIYGDTDSIMIYTGVGNYDEAESIGREIQQKINDQYKGSVMEIALDGIFKRLLLLKKKRYASLTETKLPDGSLKTEQVNKGLDIVRRDWCDLTKDIGNFILQLILNSDDEKIKIFQLIKEYLEDIDKNIKEHLIPLEKFVITKSLSRQPEEYKDADIQPHVQVAIAMRQRGNFVQPGDQIPYVITKGSADWYSRAKHPKDIENPEDIDYEWYLSQQILPPIQRITSPLGTEVSQLAKWLGMTSLKYKKNTSSSSTLGSYEDFQNDENTFLSLNEDFRYKNCLNPYFVCSHGHSSEFSDQDSVCSEGFNCKQCSECMSLETLQNQMTMFIRKFLKQYQNWHLVCTECEKESRFYRERKLKCTAHRCTGEMKQSYTAMKLFHQLSFLSKLFTIDTSDQTALLDNQQSVLATLSLKKIIDSYLLKLDKHDKNLQDLCTPTQIPFKWSQLQLQK